MAAPSRKKTFVDGAVLPGTDLNDLQDWVIANFLAIGLAVVNNATPVQGKNAAGTTQYNIGQVDATDKVMLGDALVPSVLTGTSLAVTLGSLAAAGALVSFAGAFNNAAAVMTALRLNVTDTASAAASLLADLQVGGVSKFSVDKSGKVGVLTNSPLAQLDVRGLALILDAGATSPGTGANDYLGMGDGVKMLRLGYDKVANKGRIQAIQWGVSTTLLALNPDGGSVAVGTALLYADAVNNVVGFGTATPAAGVKAHIAGDLRWDGTSTTSATGGAATALPAAPQGYIQVNIAGTNRKIAYYAT